MRQRLLILSSLLLMVAGCGGGGSDWVAPKADNNENSGEKKEETTTTGVACSRKGSGKEIYIPNEFKSKPFDRTDYRYCYARSAESENIIVFWEAGFGDDPSTAPDYKGTNMKVDIDDLLDQAETFYSLYKNDLGFIKSGSYADKYKMMIMLNYSLEGTAYGGSYDIIGALWVTPLRTQDVRLNAIAHELGHSFQFQLGIDGNTGFGSGGIYEMTSQWMLWQTNPIWMDDETYHWDAFMKQTHYAFMHPENMYHSPFVLEYWSSIHGQTFIADLWRAAKGSEQVVEVYKKLTGIDQESFNDEIYDACARFINYDLPRVKDVCTSYANRHSSTLQTADDEGWQEISSSRVPQQYGYNGIKLTAPKSGETVKIGFKGLSSYATAGWRFGFVGTKKDGTIVYGDMNKASGTDEVTAEFTADADYSYFWLVVAATPTKNVQYDVNATDFLEYPYAVKIY